MLEFKVLGPLRVLVDTEEVPVDDPVDRAFLTGLLLNANQPVPPVRVITEHWPEATPLPADLTAQVVGSADRLRHLIDALPGTTRLVDRRGEYELEVDEELIDYTKARSLYEESRHQQPTRRAELLRKAIKLWSTTETVEVSSFGLLVDIIRDLKRDRPGTVWIVGSGPPSPEAREAVLRAVKELGYTESHRPDSGDESPNRWRTTGSLFEDQDPAANFSGVVGRRPGTTSTMAVSMYVSDEAAHETVESAVETALASAGLAVVNRDDPIIGSWFRKLRARQLGAVAAHAVDSRLVLGQDAQVTSTLLQNLGPVLTALQPVKEAVVRMGAVLIVKLDEQVVVHQLTSEQQLQLDHQPQLAMTPQEILAVLRLATSEEATQDIPQRPLREIT